MPYEFRKEGSRVALIKKATGEVVAHFKSMAAAKAGARVREYFKHKGGK